MQGLKTFREKLMPMSGSLYDKRLYRIVRWTAVSLLPLWGMVARMSAANSSRMRGSACGDPSSGTDFVRHRLPQGEGKKSVVFLK
jgi:hypothetical protein